MSIKLITYDIHDDDKRAECLKKIKENYTYIEVGKSDYLLSTSKSCKAIKDDFKEFIGDDPDDELFVCTINEDEWSSWHIGEPKRDWIKDNI